MLERNRILLASALLLASPVFFSTNVIFGRAAQLSVHPMEPFTLAFLRWSISALILILVCRAHWPAMMTVLRQQWQLLALCGFLAMWICGAMVYWALAHTNATNGTLIYTISPVIILLVEQYWRGRPVSWREMSGIALAFLGVLAIVLRGNPANLLQLSFNKGDLIFLAAALAWAIYAVVLKSKVFAHLPTLALFALVAGMGALLLAPFALGEIITSGNFPVHRDQWLTIAGIVLLSSLIAFSTFQFGVKALGPAVASIFMYMLAPSGLGLAWLLLGETLEPFHLAGSVMILGGVVIATFPVALFRRRAGRLAK